MSDYLIDCDDPLQKWWIKNAVINNLIGKKIIHIRDYTGASTMPQLRYYWGVVVKYVTDHTGDSGKNVHNHLKEAVLPYISLTHAINLTTKGFDVRQMSEFIRLAKDQAEMEFEMRIPGPHEVIRIIEPVTLYVPVSPKEEPDVIQLLGSYPTHRIS